LEVACKCAKCGKYYNKPDNTATSCVFHPGLYQKGETSSLIRIAQGKWSCCKKLERADIGCKRGSHEEEMGTTTMLNTFANSTFILSSPKPAVTVSPKPPTPETLEEDIPDEILEGGFIKHFIKSTDTLQGLALKYDCSVDKIKKSNEMFHQGTHITQKALYIPGPYSKIEQSPHFEDKKSKQPSVMQSAKKLMKAVGCDREEAIFYVEQAKGDYEKALAKHTEDEQWAKQNKKTPPLFQQNKVSGYGTMSRSTENLFHS